MALSLKETTNGTYGLTLLLKMDWYLADASPTSSLNCNWRVAGLAKRLIPAEILGKAEVLEVPPAAIRPPLWPGLVVLK